MLDGTPNTDTGANDGQYTQLSLDAVGEFKLQNSAFNAEFGRNAGVLITSTTRSGGKQFRGTLVWLPARRQMGRRARTTR